MKKILLFWAAALLILSAGCSRKCENDGTAAYAPVGGRIQTPWAESVSADLDARGNLAPDRFGYPRMQMQRAEWQCLNGLWDWQVVARGCTPVWGETGAQGKILVPYPVESSLSGVGRTVSPDEELWYSRTFTLPRTWAGRSVILHFGTGRPRSM